MPELRRAEGQRMAREATKVMNYTNPEARCPACLTTLSGAKDPEGTATPKPGDGSVCVYCTAALIFNSDLTLRVMRPDEYEALPPKLRRELDAIRAAAAVVSQWRSKA